MDVSKYLDKNGKPSARKLVGADELLRAATPWMLDTASNAERVWNLHHGHATYHKSCLVCGSPVTKFRSWSDGYKTDFCSSACGSSSPRKIKIDSEQREAREREQAKRRETAVQRQRESRRLTNLQRYGTEFPWQADEVKARRLKTVGETTTARWQEQLAAERVRLVSEYSGSRDAAQLECLACGTKFTMTRFQYTNGSVGHACPTCFPRSVSAPQREIADWLRSEGVNVRLNDRALLKNKAEIDIFVADMHLAIEYDGSYSHCERGRPDIKAALARKRELYESAGLRWIMISSDEWDQKREIVKSRLRSACGIICQKIAARQCAVEPLSPSVARQFFDRCHLQGFNPAKVHLGLVHNGEVVAAASFGSCRFGDRQSMELIRLASELNTSVVGGASKLIKAWKKDNPSTTLISYSDLRWGAGGVYEKAGFSLDGETGMGYCYVKGRLRRSRQQMMKHKLSTILENFDPKLSERENCFNNGWYRLWDLGHRRWILK